MYSDSFVAPGTPPAPELSIDELARTAGTLTSTARMYQARGLLPPPRRAGRNAFYGPAHLERLQLIDRLQEQGFSLAGIKQLLDAWDTGASLPDALGLRPPSGAPPVTLTPAELAARLAGVELTPALMMRAVEGGLVELGTDGTVTVPDPRFLVVGPELAALGVPPDRIVDEWVALRAIADDIAGRFRAVFADEIWPRAAVGATDQAELVADASNLLAKLLPLAHAVVDAALEQAMRRVVDEFAEQQRQQLAGDVPGSAAMARRRAPAAPRPRDRRRVQRA